MLALLLLLCSLAHAATRVAVLDLSNRTGDSSLDGAGAGVAGILVAKLTRVDTLEVVERSRLADVMGELALGKSGAVDPATAAKAGHLLGASHFVTGEIISVKLPSVALALRVIDVESGQVIAATDVVGEVGDTGEEFFVLVDDAAFKIVEALQLSLGARDRIELGQVDVRGLRTIESYGKALEALDRGDRSAASSLLSEALALEPGFRIASDTLASLAAEVSARRGSYANEAITRVHEGWEQIEAAVKGELPAAPTAEDLARAAVRARMLLVRGELDAYLALEEKRVAATLAGADPLLTKAFQSAIPFDKAVTAIAGANDYARARTLSNLSIWPYEVRLQMADVLLLTGRKEQAIALVIENYQHPGPTPSVSTLPRSPLRWAEHADQADLMVVGRKQELRQAELRGNEGDIRTALKRLEEVVAKAQAAHEHRAAWEAVNARLSREKASKELLQKEEQAMRAVSEDPSIVLAGYRAYAARVKSGYYAAVQGEGDYRDLAERWLNLLSGAWDGHSFVDQRLGAVLEYQEHVPARDAEDEARRRKRLDDYVNGAYTR